VLHNGKWLEVILPGIAIFYSYFAGKIVIKKFIFPAPQKYFDFEIHIQEKTKFQYLVDVIKSPAGEAIEGDFKLDLEEFKDILSHLQSLSADRPKVRKFGTNLFNAIFQDQATGRYNESWGNMGKSKDERLGIKLRIESPELMRLPWEYLYDPVRRSHLALDKKLSIVRYLLVPKDIEPLEVEPPLKILLVISTPSDYAPLQVDKEKTKIDISLKKLNWKRQVKMDVIRNVTVEKFRDKIQVYHVIHFIGHGGFIEQQKEEIGCLIFENEAGFSELMDAEQLSLLVCQI
jgi:hypothetical protein